MQQRLHLLLWCIQILDSSLTVSPALQADVDCLAGMTRPALQSHGISPGGTVYSTTGAPVGVCSSGAPGSVYVLDCCAR